MWLGLKPSQNPQYLVSGPNEAEVLDISSQKEFSERQSDRSEVDLFRYREKHTAQTECVPSQRATRPPDVSWLVFIKWAISYVNGWEVIPAVLGEGWRFPGCGPPPTPWSFNSALELSWHLWVCHFTC